MVIDCIIPARSGSKSISNKNITLLGGYPLLAYSIAAAKLSSKVHNIYVSTDSREYADIAKIYGAEVLYLRPRNISRDHSMDIDFFQYHIDFFNKNNLNLPDYFINLRPTTPLRESKIIDDAVNVFINDKTSTSLRSAHKVALTPYKMFKRDGKHMRPFLTDDSIVESHSAARQLFDDAYVGNGYIDIVDPVQINEKNMLYGDNIFLYETDIVSDIDRSQDLLNSSNQLHNDQYKDLLNYMEKCRKK